MTPRGDRRRAARRTPGAAEPAARLRLRAGRELTVVDLAPGGALVEGEGRLLPGTHVDVHVIGTEGRVLVRSRVTRAFVHRLWSDRILYRGALAFERQIELGAGYDLPSLMRGAEPHPGTCYPSHCA